MGTRSATDAISPRAPSLGVGAEVARHTTAPPCLEIHEGHLLLIERAQLAAVRVEHGVVVFCERPSDLLEVGADVGERVHGHDIRSGEARVGYSRRRGISIHLEG